MPVQDGISSLSTVAVNNGPDGATELPSVLDDYQRSTQALLKRSLAIGGSLSATLTLNIPDSYRYVEIQSAGEIVDISDSNSWDGREISLRFNAACTLSHSSNFALIGQLQIVAPVGAHARFVRRTSGTWEMTSYETAAANQVFGTIDVHGQASFSATLVAGAVVSSSILGIVAGTRMLFQQTAAPTGWTKEVSATYNDAALRLQTGTVTTGGADAFSTHFGTGKSTAGFTLTTAEMPAHSHNPTSSGTTWVNDTAGGVGFSAGARQEYGALLTSTGGGGSHAHTLNNFNLKWVDIIVATKD